MHDRLVSRRIDALHQRFLVLYYLILGVCDGAKMRQGIGYNPHPFDCTQFVQCFYYDRGLRVDPIYRNCEYGTFWNQEVMRCEQADLVDCPHGTFYLSCVMTNSSVMSLRGVNLVKIVLLLF